MKKITLLTFLLIAGFGYSQTYDLLENFDTVTDNVTWLNDNGSTIATVENTAISGSNAVASDGNYGQIITQQTSAPWQAGALIMQDNYLDLATQREIQVDVYSDAATFILAKAVGAIGGGAEGATDASHPGGGWATLTFDFDNPKDGGAAAVKEFASVFFFPNWNGAGWDGDCNVLCNNGTDPANSPVSTTAYDNLKGKAGGAIPIPISSFSDDFESGLGDYSEGADGGTFIALANPDTANNVNASANSAQLSGINTNLYTHIEKTVANGLDLSSGDIGFSIQVKSSTNNIPVKFKLEGGTATEEDLVYTGNGDWQQLDFDFSGSTTTNNSKVVVFFDIENSTVPGGDVLIDNIVMAPFSTLSTNEFKSIAFKTFPNPTQDNWTVKTQAENITSIQVYDVLGKNVMSLTADNNEVKIDGSKLNTGLYFAKIETVNGINTIRLIKN